MPALHEWALRPPVFIPSVADPEAGYRARPHVVELSLERSSAMRLRVDYDAPAARYADLEIHVNGAIGFAYPRPEPGDHVLGAGSLEVVLPAEVLRRGPNRIQLIARDDGDFARIDNPEKVLRLDRTAAGLAFRHIALTTVDTTPAAVWCGELVPTVLYVGEADRLRERCLISLRLGRGVRTGVARLRAGGAEASVPFAGPFGEVRASIDVADGEGDIDYEIAIDADGERFEFRGSVARRRKWNVYVAPHVHTDIGYTHRQWEVAERLSRNIDTALELIARDGYAYHLDSAWTLEQWRATRGAARQSELAKAIAQGRFGISASYVDLLTQLPTAEGLVRNVVLGHELARQYGAPAEFAAVVDVPSASASLPAILSSAGVRYLVHASNQDRGPFLFNGGLHRRDPFWWRGAAGDAVLVWISLGYCELRKVCGSPPTAQAAERGLDLFLCQYESGTYAPDAVLVYGQEADNTDLDPQPARFVAAWNETYAYPRLIACQPAAFFRDVERRFGDRLPAVSGDGGAFWEDGALSSMAETIAMRASEASLLAAERLTALATLRDAAARFPFEDFDAAWRSLLLYAEHTWGAFLSTAEPEALIAADQWSVKRNFARDAEQRAAWLLHQAAATHALRLATSGREIVVHNPHSWRVSGTATVEIAPNEVPVDPESGAIAPHRRVRTLDTQALVEVAVDDLPGLSFRRFALRAGATPRQSTEPARRSITLENERHRVAIDPARGCAVSWWDKRLDRELVAEDRYGLGQVLYVTGGEGTRIVRSDPALPLPELALNDDFRLSAAHLERSAIGDRARLEGEVPFGPAVIEWSLPRQGEWVELTCRFEKRATLEKEAAYVAFPFALPDAVVRSDSQLGWIDWDRDRLPGACVEWLPLQTVVRLETPGVGVVLASPDVPLFCVGDIVRGTWAADARLRGGRLFSYVLNNYWHTNYRAAQSGEIVVRYRLVSDAAIDAPRAHRIGWEARRPLYGHRISFQDFREPEAPYDARSTITLAKVEPDSVALSTLLSARRGEGWIARVQELAGREQTARITFPGLRVAQAWRVDHLENEIAELTRGESGELRVSVGPWMLATVRFILAR